MSQGANSEASMTIGSSVIPILNKLHDIVAPVGAELAKISLPHVAVVGSQSSGKSSVLEALVGRDFLPRGCDICTRRPLSLMLEQRSVAPGDDHREWGEFRHLPGKRFYDFLKIRQEIQAETEREVGFNKGVSDKQIRLKIYSPNVLNMTLIDLPGITKVPVGDQPSDIEARIRKMIMEHIIQKNCIILAVTPANSDLATSDALQIAREADPTGSRTIGVITKLDIMDRGTNACNFLLGRVIPLRLGYVGVVNRSQEDINENRSIKEALAHEERFFCDHHVYNGLRDCCGIPQLAKKLNQILEQHIQRELPSLRAELNSRKIIVAEELQIYGEVVESKAEQGAILLSILTQYCADFIAILDGKNEMMSSKELFGGARILYIFQTVFVRSLEEVDPCADISDEDIQTAIRNASGLRGALFVPEVPFEVLVRRQIARLLDPSLQCLRFVYDEMLKIARACRVTELHRFPLLRRCLDEVAGKFLRDGVIPAERMIGNLIEMEMDYINSSHPNFLGGKKAVDLAHQMMRSIQPPSILKPLEGTEEETVEVIVTKLLLQSYYDIVRKNIQDLVPKAIMHFLVNYTKKDLHNTCIQKLYRENLLDELLQEQEDVFVKRKHARDMFNVLQQAVQTLDEVESEMQSKSTISSMGAETTTGLPKVSGFSGH
ncbi:dynamin-related protein 3A-like [Tripterygium wilfordii]|uniref:Dynamin-related protein 3A-like n=1 Tax=Tripterygium wilfordii TaxID=458696 RepID=A0A7J7DP39_TRIWF|nr:dynamin-related protein 3A-like [Tripterygium wilfordii]